MVDILWHLKTYPLIIIMLLGLFGNIMIFYIFIRKNFRDSSITKYIKILAVADTIVLCSGTIPNIYEGFNKRSLTGMSTLSCIIHRFVMFYSGDVSIWILTVISVDRLVAVVYPVQNSRWKSSKNTLFIFVLVFTSALLKNFPIYFTFKRNENNSDCITRESMELYEYKVRPAISLIFYYLIPMITMSVSTVLIMWKMNDVIGRMSGQTGVMKRSTNNIADNHQNYSKSLTKMSIAITILFIVLITPSITIWTMLSYSRVNEKIMAILYDITNVFVFTHHSMNFYLFFLSGPRFRHEVMTIFGQKYVDVEDSRDYSHKNNKILMTNICAEATCN